jgi:DNA-binding NtrC family response regulator
VLYSGRILIIDDDANMQKLLQAWLEPVGYETVTASNGEQALNSLGQSTFDLALVDYLMPRMNGLNLLDFGLVIEAMRRGALDCVMKPTPEDNLLLILDETMERHWARELGLPPLPSWRGHDLSTIGNASSPSIPDR